MASQPQFDSKTDGVTVARTYSDSVKGRTFIITGVSPNGLGQSTAEALASQEPHRLILTGRSREKVYAVLDPLSQRYPKTIFQFLLLDLSSIKETRKAAQEIMKDPDIERVDCVICNAGVMTIPQLELSEDGIEMHLQTNHIGHYLFVNLIMEKVIAAAEASSVAGSTRIVVLTSFGHYTSPMRFSDYNFTKTQTELPEEERANLDMLKAFNLSAEGIYNPSIAYGQSKTANCLYSIGLNRQLRGKADIKSYAVHPGIIVTELFRHDMDLVDDVASLVAKNGMQVKTKEQGCSTTLVAALDPGLGSSNLEGDRVYLSDCQVGESAPWAKDSEAADRLWQLSESLVQQKFSW